MKAYKKQNRYKGFFTATEKLIRFFRKDTGLLYHVSIPAKIGDRVLLEDDSFGYHAFGVLKERKDLLVIDMGNRHFTITNEVKDNILGGNVERFYFKGIKN